MNSLVSIFLFILCLNSSAFASDFIAYCVNPAEKIEMKLVRTGEQYAVLDLIPKTEGPTEWKRTSVNKNYSGVDYHYNNSRGTYGFTLVSPPWYGNRWGNTVGFTGFPGTRSYRVICEIDTPNFTREFQLKHP
jgi:hypothetical protein